MRPLTKISGKVGESRCAVIPALPASMRPLTKISGKVFTDEGCVEAGLRSLQ